MSKARPGRGQGTGEVGADGLAKLQAAAKKTGKPVNGWNILPMNLANFGTDYGDAGR